jgi:DNA-binding transcriptional MerR regulator
LDKSQGAFRTISEVSVEIDVPKHVLRFWESKFTQIKPMKLGGGRRYYRPQDLDLLRGIRGLLYEEGYTIKGVQRILRQHGVKYVKDPALWRDAQAETPKVTMIPDVAADVAARSDKRLAGKRGQDARNGHRASPSDTLGGILQELLACRAKLGELCGESVGKPI